MRFDLIVKHPLKPAKVDNYPLFTYKEQSIVPVLTAPSFPDTFEKSLQIGYQISLLKKGFEFDVWNIVKAQTEFEPTKVMPIPPSVRGVSFKKESPKTDVLTKKELFEHLRKVGKEKEVPSKITKVQEKTYASSPSQILGRSAIHEDSPNVSSPQHKLAAARAAKDYNYSYHMYHSGQSRDFSLPEKTRQEHARLADAHAHGWKVADVRTRAYESTGVQDKPKHHEDWAKFHTLNPNRYGGGSVKHGVQNTLEASSISRRQFHEKNAGIIPGEIERKPKMKKSILALNELFNLVAN